ncbi:MAG: hypothetical protein ACXVYB_00210 [Arthrobacter sp.]
MAHSKEAPTPLTNWDRADQAATALQYFHDEQQGCAPGLGESYGDEGSDEMAEAIVNLLTGLKHLTLRSGLMFPDLNDEATDRWEKQLEEEGDGE